VPFSHSGYDVKIVKMDINHYLVSLKKKSLGKNQG
jgi:hypothetical protein